MSTCKTSSEIWEQHSVKLKAFVCSKVNGDDICHDILHDVFLKIDEKKERITWIEQPTSYVIKMAQNAIVDYYRTQKNATHLLEDDYIQSTDQLSEIQLADCCLEFFIKGLPPVYREALILTVLEGLSQKDLAVKLNISYSGAKSRIQRARKLLKDAILACCPYQFDKYGNIIGCCR